MFKCWNVEMLKILIRFALKMQHIFSTFQHFNIWGLLICATFQNFQHFNISTFEESKSLPQWGGHAHAFGSNRHKSVSSLVHQGGIQLRPALPRSGAANGWQGQWPPIALNDIGKKWCCKIFLATIKNLATRNAFLAAGNPFLVTRKQFLVARNTSLAAHVAFMLQILGNLQLPGSYWISGGKK